MLSCQCSEIVPWSLMCSFSLFKYRYSKSYMLINVTLEATIAIPRHGVQTLMVVSIARVMMAGKETARTATVTDISEAWAVKTNVNEILGKTGLLQISYL